MPLKKDDSGKRWVEMELIVPGTPEQVWQAVTTGPGNTAWFTKARIEEHVGGTLSFDFGPMGDSKGEVTAWEPPFRFGYVERDWSEGAPPVATEITVTGRSGDRCVVRMVHSLFASVDDWDDQLEGFESGWPAFFDVLRIYLADFAGLEAASFSALVGVEQDQAHAWKRLTGALGVGGVDVGERRAIKAGPGEFSGIIERLHQDGRQRYVLMRMTAPISGVLIFGTYGTGTGANASLSCYLYGAEAERSRAANEPVWRAWLEETFRQG